MSTLGYVDDAELCPCPACAEHRRLGRLAYRAAELFKAPDGSCAAPPFTFNHDSVIGERWWSYPPPTPAGQRLDANEEMKARDDPVTLIESNSAPVFAEPVPLDSYWLARAAGIGTTTLPDAFGRLPLSRFGQ